MEKIGPIGIFDSGLGGLWILKSLREALPQYDYVFFGDQANVPYGTKSVEELFECTTKVLTYLYEEKHCTCVLLACNTTSATIHPRLREWVAEKYPGRKVFGIVYPTVLAITSSDPVAVFATTRTVESHAYKDGIMKNTGSDNVSEIALPELASRIEHGDETASYIESFKETVSDSVRTGVLGCTHYGIVRHDFTKAFPQIVTWISQEEIVPPFLKAYLQKDAEFDSTLSKERKLEIIVSKESHVFDTWLSKWYGDEVKAITVNL